MPTPKWKIPLFDDNSPVAPIQTPLNAQSLALDSALTDLQYQLQREGIVRVSTPAERDQLFPKPVPGDMVKRVTADNAWIEMYQDFKTTETFGAMTSKGWLREGGKPLSVNNLAVNIGGNLGGGGVYGFLATEITVDVFTKCHLFAAGMVFAPGNAAGFLQLGLKRPGESATMWESPSSRPLGFNSSGPVRWHSNARSLFTMLNYSNGFIIPPGTTKVEFRAASDAASITQEMSNFTTVLRVGV